jgi:ATP-dependent Clp protease ATP-binding subunit ClpC
MELVITTECKDLIAKEGYNPTYGARPLRRAIQRMLEDNLAEQVLQGTFKEGDFIETVLEGEVVKFQKQPGKVAAPKEKTEKEEAKAAKSEKAEKPEKGSKSKDGDKASEKEAVE